MTLRSALAGLALVAAASAAPMGAAGAAETPAFAAAANRAAVAHPGEAYSQYYGRNYYGRRGYYGRPYGYRRGYGGGAVAAGVIGGLALGALAAGAATAAPGPVYGGYGPGVPVGNVYGADPNWVNYCASRYRSFDPRTGTYLANDGYRYPCQ